ncbi:acetokinase family protein, partial [Vibrio harveyi]
RVQIN